MKRKALFEEIKKLPKVEMTADDIVSIIHEGREERSRTILEACGFYEEAGRMREAL